LRKELKLCSPRVRQKVTNLSFITTLIGSIGLAVGIWGTAKAGGL